MTLLYPKVGNVTFMEKHCYANTYTFQLKKCLDGNCRTCSIQPPRLPMETFSKLHFVPAPTLDSSKQHYNKFEDLYGSKPTEKDKPSLTFSLEVIEEDKRNKTTLVSQRVRDVVKCSVCHRPRCVYANTKLNTHLMSALIEIKDNGDYACGGTLVADEDPR